VFYAKTLIVIAVFMWVRWSLPRFRFDQIMTLAWRALIPISLLQLMVTAVLVYAWGGHGREYMRINGWFALSLLGANLAIGHRRDDREHRHPAGAGDQRRMVIKGSPV
jgi:hypothetical protein